MKTTIKGNRAQTIQGRRQDTGIRFGKLPFYIIELLKGREERLDGQEEAVRGQKQELAEQNKKLEEMRKTLCKYGRNRENCP